MKRWITIIAALLFSATVFAQQPAEDEPLCDIWARKCLAEKEQLQKEVKELRDQLKKGEKTLSPREKKNLRLKLKETEKKLEDAEKKSTSRPSP